MRSAVNPIFWRNGELVATKPRNAIRHRKEVAKFAAIDFNKDRRPNARACR